MAKPSKHPQADVIRSFAWNCTIGQGLVGDDFPSEPDGDVIVALARVLGRPIASDDFRELEHAWQQCEQEQANP